MMYLDITELFEEVVKNFLKVLKFSIPMGKVGQKL